MKVAVATIHTPNLQELANLTNMINKKVAESQQASPSSTTSNAQVLPPDQIPAGYYQASDGLLYKK